MIADVISEFRRIMDSGAVTGGALRLGCAIEEPATPVDIDSAWPQGGAPTEAVELWSVSGSAKLFVDIDYGQWGLRILSPRQSAERTRAERMERAEDFREDDVVVAEFLGDGELVAISPSEQGARRILVAQEIYGRPDWYGVGPTLEKFLQDYLDSGGEKFWE
ncbi:hypothetical protein I6A84_23370 [Frankia sp. CNm7]|uniref:Knr4/Smi1-like domain-containing protein n=1 Tax=Frankia nepalensis TaxID=1836974 RepID=A0A937RD90_9ACTN|nr:hypothetical protein [Frankia nepalensis]MBL7499890.1 hypothetical protein [Frankia nepalensis]MBL7512292.1 hypothetical protein [Frankia nepalensis]MBL7520947.1 hypothetical protein [Frankia nepalensis]MBL7628310.1 hypothetical protein [Frankia nepalensis]